MSGSTLSLHWKSAGAAFHWAPAGGRCNPGRVRVTRKLVWTSIGTVLVLGLAFALVTPWLARRMLTRVGQTKGWQVQASGARLGLRGVWFTKVQFDKRRDAVLHAELGSVLVRWFSIIGQRSVSVGSGVVRAEGSWEQLNTLREPVDGERSTSNVSSSSADFDLHDIAVEWYEHEGGTPTVSLRILEAERISGRTKSRISGLSARYRAVSVELKNVRIDAVSAANARASEPPVKVLADEFQIKYDTASLNAKGTSTERGAQTEPPFAAAGTLQEPLSRAAGSTAEPSSRATDPANASPPSTRVPPVKDVGKLASSASSRMRKPAAADGSSPWRFDAAATGKKELLPVLAQWMDGIEQLRTQISGPTSTSSPMSPSSQTSANQTSTSNQSTFAEWISKIPIASSFESLAFRVRIVDMGQKLDLGPWPLRAERQASELKLEIAQAAILDRSALSAHLTVAEGLQSAKAKFSVGPIGLLQLGITEGDFGLENIVSSELQLEAFAEFQAASGIVSTESKGRVARMSIRQPFLARQTIRNVGFEWEGAATLDSSKRQLRTEKLRLSAGRVSALMTGDIELGLEHHVVDGKLEVPLAACQDLFDALPEGLAPLLSGWRVNGTFATRSAVSFDSRQPNKSTVKVRIENACRVLSVPSAVNPTRFQQPFVLEIENAQGIPEPTSFGPGTWGYVSLNGISPYIQSALLVCEDGRFVHHDGFDREAIQNSIRENLRTGRFARGASTISMQLAKNLYLRRDKTISRKVQESALTMLLEQSLSKSQLLELYLNVIEFGPGLYGIGPAAKHYFATTPDRLTLAQSFFLISILPNPKLAFFGADGHVHAGRMKFLRTLMAIAHKRGHFSQAELDAGLEEQLTFGVPGDQAIAPSNWLLKDPRGSLDYGEMELPEIPDNE